MTFAVASNCCALDCVSKSRQAESKDERIPDSGARSSRSPLGRVRITESSWAPTLSRAEVSIDAKERKRLEILASIFADSDTEACSRTLSASSWASSTASAAIGPKRSPSPKALIPRREWLVTTTSASWASSRAI